MKRKMVMAVLLAVGLTGICQFSDNVGVTIPYTAYAANAGTVTGSSLRVRTGAGTDKAALTYNGSSVMLSKGTKVTIKKAVEEGETTWYQVSFSYSGKTLTGYVSGDYVKVTEETDDSSSKATDSTSTTAAASLNAPARVMADSLNVRKTASTKGTKVTSLKKGASVKVLKEKLVGGKKWYYISFTVDKKTQKGYVLSDYISLTLSKNIAGTINSSSAVKIRKGAGTDKPYLQVSSKTVSLKKGVDVVVKKEAVDTKGNKWLQISFYYNNKLYSGYVNAEKIKLFGIITVTGKVTGTDTLNVRVAAGTDKKQLTYGKTAVKLKKDTSINILGQTEVKGTIWYQGSFSYEGKTLKGFVSSDYIKITQTTNVPASIKKAADGETEEKPDANTNTDDTNTDNTNTDNANTDNTNTDTSEVTDTNPGMEQPMSSVEFETYMTEQGFPETYKNNLRVLHEKHPTWIFRAYQTGLDWETVITKESKAGLNLISKNKANGWKSYAEKAYDWATDTFIPYDGSTWVTASTEAIAYYMDPRNFLTERAIFQFEALEYQSEYETVDGVEKILANTPLYQKTFTYTDDVTGETKEITYAQAFMDAAAASGVSPYHLASRVKQEVVIGTTSLSSSVSGMVSGYEGYYNFYNIGATHSTQSGGAVANGLAFAKGDSRTTAAGKIEYLIPWDNQYKAIVGGAKYIGKQYINRGQNTIYLQKFNVTATSTYSHQYMANVEAANSEATKLYNGYVSMLDSMPIVFNIPVYQNMPESAAGTPGIVPSPNNWLKMLKLGNYSLMPEFSAKDGGKVAYSLNLTGLTDSSLLLTAVPVSSKAAVEVRLLVNGNESSLGNGTTAMIPVNTGTSELKIVVTAETGVTNTYTITIIK